MIHTFEEFTNEKIVNEGFKENVNNLIDIIAGKMTKKNRYRKTLNACIEIYSLHCIAMPYVEKGEEIQIKMKDLMDVVTCHNLFGTTSIKVNILKKYIKNNWDKCENLHDVIKDRLELDIKYAQELKKQNDEHLKKLKEMGLKYDGGDEEEDDEYFGEPLFGFSDEIDDYD